MKKIIIILFLIVINFQSFSQESILCGEIQYLQSTHFSRDFSRNFVLKFNNNESLYSETNVSSTKEKITQENKAEGRQFDREASRNNIKPEFYYNDRRSFHFMEVWFNEEIYVQEDAFQWSWKIGKETKKIGSFECQNATIHFRGRDYTAWFAKEIPVSFGPWKFQGLLGLILEVYDDDKVFHILAQEVHIERAETCSINVDKVKLESAFNIQKYLSRVKELIKEDFAKLSSRLPKGSKTLVYDEDCDDCREEVEKFSKN